MVTIIDGGLYTTVQDLGRPGYYGAGIPPSGAMDQFAHIIANILVGNSPNAATLEATLLGPKIRFDAETMVAVTGANLTPTVNGVVAPMWESFRIQPGGVVQTGLAQCGCRAYIAVAGGLEVPLVLGSRSTYAPGYLGGHRGRPLKSGVVLKSGAIERAKEGCALPVHLRPSYPRQLSIAIILGPQDDLFSAAGVSKFLNSEYHVSVKTDRTASRLIGPIPDAKVRETSVDEGSGPTDIIEDGNALGAIQIAGGSEVIVMLRDAPSTGAYAKIATVISSELDAIGQARPGDRIRFVQVSVAESRARLINQNRLLASAIEMLQNQK